MNRNKKGEVYICKFLPIVIIIVIVLVSYINYNSVERFPSEIPTVKLIINEKNILLSQVKEIRVIKNLSVEMYVVIVTFVIQMIY